MPSGSTTSLSHRRGYPSSLVPSCNRSLDHLMMSHNNVGRSGARAVFMALRQRARPGVELLVDLQSCELGSESGEDLFDMYSPSGRYGT